MVFQGRLLDGVFLVVFLDVSFQLIGFLVHSE